MDPSLDLSDLSDLKVKRKSEESPDGSSDHVKRQISQSSQQTPEFDKISVGPSMIQTFTSSQVDNPSGTDTDDWSQTQTQVEPHTESINISDLLYTAVTSPEFTKYLIPTLSQVIENSLPTILENKLEESIAKAVSNALKPLIDHIEHHEKRLESCHEEISNHKVEIEKLNDKITSLEIRLEEAEQYSRRNCLRFNNVPPTLHKDKSPDQVIINICNKIGVDVDIGDISRAHPLGPPRDGKINYVARFISYRKRQSIFMNKKRLKGAEGKMYIDEHLTPQRRSMMHDLWELRKNNAISAYWSHDGRIFVKKSEDSAKILIKDEKSLAALKQPGPVK